MSWQTARRLLPWRVLLALGWGGPDDTPSAGASVAASAIMTAEDQAMRIATWNVNSLRARLDKVTWWLERARPHVLLMQETKLSDAHAPVDGFGKARYELGHHG